jgi:hypothetical protein
VKERLQAGWQDVDRRKRDRQFEAAPPGASRIQVEHAVGRLDLRHMGMTGHHDVDVARDRIDLQGFQIVQNVDRPSRKSNEFSFGICDSPVADNPRYLGSR